MLKIAGIRYLLEPEKTLWTKFLEEYDHSFLTGPFGHDHHSDIHINVQVDSIPDIESMVPLVRGDRWSVYKEQGKYCMAFRDPVSHRNLWAGVFDRECRNIVVHISKDMKKFPCTANSFPLDQLLLAFTLALGKGALVHSAGIGFSDNGFMFSGHSGAGKSTLSRLFTSSSSIDPLSDERVVIRNENGNLMVHGTPWHSDARMVGNNRFPLKAIFFINHGTENRIDRCSPSSALKKLIPQVMIPWYDQDSFPLILDFCGEIITRTPVYNFYFRPDQSAVEAILKFSETL
jgi:hypothetical protein